MRSPLPLLDGRALDFVKVAAVAFMVIDHVNLIWFDHAYIEMLMIGRATYPLFCYALVRGLQKANPARADRYVQRLFIGAMLAETVTAIARHGFVEVPNVIFTLALGAIVALALRQVRAPVMFAIAVAGAALMAAPQTLEFGAVGVLLPAALLRVMDGRRGDWPALALLLVALNQADYLGTLQQASAANVILAAVITASMMSGLAFLTLKLGEMLPQSGRYLSKYFLYVFYPLHFVLLRGVMPFFI